MIPYETKHTWYLNISNLTNLKSTLAHLEKLPSQDVKSGGILSTGIWPYAMISDKFHNITCKVRKKKGILQDQHKQDGKLQFSVMGRIRNHWDQLSRKELSERYPLQLSVLQGLHKLWRVLSPNVTPLLELLTSCE